MNSPCDGVMGGLGSLMHLKTQHPHLQVILSIGGAESSDVYPEVAADPVRRDNFAQSVHGLIEASGLDGIDINWVYPCGTQQGADFLSLLLQVRMYLAPDQYLVAASLPAAKEVLQYFDLQQIAEYVDLINLAAYDLYGPWSSRSGHHAQLYSTSKDEPSGSGSVQYLMNKGVPAKKILLGVPMYGRNFLGVTGPGHRFTPDVSSQSDGTIGYCHLPSRGTREQVDKRAVAAHCSGGDGGFVSYDNPETVKIKAAFCKQKALGGLFYWSTPSDSPERKRSLIAAGFNTLHGA